MTACRAPAAAARGTCNHRNPLDEDFGENASGVRHGGTALQYTIIVNVNVQINDNIVNINQFNVTEDKNNQDENYFDISKMRSFTSSKLNKHAQRHMHQQQVPSI